MKLKSVGFFKEMDHGIDTEGTIMDYIDKGNKSEDVDIYKYLESGIEIIVVPETCYDVIDREKGISGVSSEYTDGIWIWPGDLAYYVKNYNLKLPDDFITTMKNNNWLVSLTVDEIDCDDLEIDGIKVFADE